MLTVCTELDWRLIHMVSEFQVVPSDWLTNRLVTGCLLKAPINAQQHRYAINYVCKSFSFPFHFSNELNFNENTFHLPTLGCPSSAFDSKKMSLQQGALESSGQSESPPRKNSRSLEVCISFVCLRVFILPYPPPCKCSNSSDVFSALWPMCKLSTQIYSSIESS